MKTIAPAPQIADGIADPDLVASKIDSMEVRLPAHAREKLDHLEHLQNLAKGQNEARSGVIKELREERATWLDQAIHLERAINREPNVSKSDHDRLARYRDRVAKLDAKIREQQNVKDTGYFSLERVKSWLASQTANVTFTPRIIDVKAKKPFDALTTNREARADFLERRREIEIAPLPIADARARMIATIERYARAGTPDVSLLFRQPKDFAGRRRQGDIKFAERLKPKSIDEFEPDPFPTLVWICKDAMIAALDKLIADKSPAHSLSVGGRPALIAEIDAKLRELEFEEEALVCACENSGRYAVTRRHDASPEAVLQVEVISN